MDVSILIPTHNEESSLAGNGFRTAMDWIRREFPHGEVIISDDGSTDGTVRLARTLADRVLEQTHRGKAAALQAGFKAARKPYVLWADADWSVPEQEWHKLTDELLHGADFVIASRGWGRPGAPFHRWIGSCLFTLRNRHTFKWDFTDTQCGLKAARREALERILPRLKRFSWDNTDRFAGTDAMFDVECLLAARMLGMKIVELPVNWIHQRNRDRPHYGPLLRQIGKDFRAIRKHYRMGKYDPVS